MSKETKNKEKKENGKEKRTLSRAIVKVNWLHQARGHLFVTKNIDDVIYFADPQTGDADASRYFQRIDPGCAAIMRTDCVKFTSLVQMCCEH